MKDADICIKVIMIFYLILVQGLSGQTQAWRVFHTVFHAKPMPGASFTASFTPNPSETQLHVFGFDVCNALYMFWLFVLRTEHVDSI